MPPAEKMPVPIEEKGNRRQQTRRFFRHLFALDFKMPNIPLHEILRVQEAVLRSGGKITEVVRSGTQGSGPVDIYVKPKRQSDGTFIVESLLPYLRRRDIR